MASAHHLSAQQSTRYQTTHTNSRDDPVRLPSLKDLNFDYQRGHRHQDPTAPQESSINTQENSVRHPQTWGRSHSTQSSSPMPAHQQHHQLHPHQQHTPPLSAGHESVPPKIEYASKTDSGGFMTPGIPLSAQTVPVPGSVNIGLTRSDDSSQGQSKRSRRGSTNMGASRDVRTSHNTYHPPQYASYPSAQPPPSHYQQVSTTSPHPAHSPPSAIDHIHPHAAPVTHPTYGAYQQQYMAPRMYSQHPPPPQSASGNPYPSPGPPPAPPLQGHWEQAAAQHHHPHPHAPPPPPQHSQHPQYPQHVSSHHQQPPPSQHLLMHPQQHQHHPPQPLPQPQPQPLSPPPPPPPHHHPQQHPQQHQQHHQQHQQQQQQQQQHPQQHPHHVPHSQPQVQQQLQQQQLPFARTTAIVPTSIDSRTTYSVAEQERVSSARDNTMSEIVKHCQVLYSFASHYAQLQPNIQPSQTELVEMSQRAMQVVRLLEEYRRVNFPEVERVKMDSAVAMTPPDDHRPPKRPWEDLSQDGNAAGAETAAPEQQYPTPAEKPQSTAEQDMEIIRSKRATSTAGGTGAAGQPKSKYRKRSRATPPGKCHSCNIRETPEWRRGPDGARTLCNACGLHYAKLMRKSNKIHGAGGDAPRIDMDTLRASARAADLTDKPRSKRSQQSTEPTSPMESAKPLPQQHHQGSFQVVTMISQNVASNPPEPSRVPSQHTLQAMPQSTGSMSVPPPPWATAVPPPAAARGYAPDQLQHQSFIRSSQHSAVTHTSPR